LPVWAVTWHVDFKQRLPESTALIGLDVDRDGTPVDGDPEVLARKMGSADMRPAPDVPKAHRVGARAEMECAPIEDSVHGTDDRATVGCDRGERVEAHAGQTVEDLLSA